MADISAQCDETSDGWNCEVTVNDGSGQSTHIVEVPREDYDSLTDGDTDVESLVEASFEFLLDREPREAIMARFDIMTINRYFPEYPDTISEYL